MPYVTPEQALKTFSVDLATLRAERGPAPWRIPLVGTDQVRSVLIAFPPGHATVPHHHPHAIETFFVLSGSGTFEIGAAGYSASAGTLLWSPAGVQHTIVADGPADLIIIASVAPNQDRPDETIEATSS
jgi:quercetin dioxygenase-like cupin family protein